MAAEERRSMHVPAQEAFHRLIEEEPQIQGAGVDSVITKHDNARLARPTHHRSEAGRFDRSFFAVEGLQLQADAAGPQTRMLHENMLDESEIGIDHRSPHRLRTFELLRLDRVAHPVGMTFDSGAMVPIFPCSV